MNRDYSRGRIIAVNKEYPFEAIYNFQSFREADDFIDPNLFDVFFLHEKKIMKTRYKGTWGFLPNDIIKKSNPMYKKLLEKL